MPLEHAVDETAENSAIGSPRSHRRSKAVSLTVTTRYARSLASTYPVNTPPKMPLSRPASVASASSNTSLPISIASSPWNCLQGAHHPLCSGDCDTDTQSAVSIGSTSPTSPTWSWYSSACPSPSMSETCSVTSSESNRSSMISTDCSAAISDDARRWSWLSRPPALVRCTGRKRAATPRTLHIDGKHPKHPKFMSESQTNGATDLWLEYWRMHEEV